MSKKKHSHHAPIPTPDVLRSRTERAAEEGRYQHALELGKQLYKQAPTPPHLELLRRVSLGRARQLCGEGKDRDAATVLDNAVALGDGNAAWQEKVALEMAHCGNVRRALQLLAKLPPTPVHAEVLRQAADAAVQQGKAGRDQLPETLRGQWDLVWQAFRQLEAGQDEPAKETLQGIGLQSPFLEWKVLLRGLQAFYQNDDLRAMENWQRLDPGRLPARLAAPLRFGVDPGYRQAQPPETQAALKKQADRLQDQGLLLALRALQVSLANPEQLAQAFRVAENLLPTLRQQAPHLVGRLANCCYWALVHHGEPPEVFRYERVFGPSPEDPSLARLRALVFEQMHDVHQAHSHWQEFEKSIAARPGNWPKGQAERARALVWERMGRNAAALPDEKKMDLLPDFLRNHPERPKPLKPTAEACFRRSLELAPDQLETHEALFEHYRERDEPKKATQAGRGLLEHFPQHAPTLVAIGDLLLGESEYVEALSCYQRAQEANPLDQGLRGKISTVHLFHARSHAEEGRFDEARVEYQAALGTTGTRDNSGVLCKWAACEFKAGNVERAEELLGQALASPGGRLAVAFSMVIETIRLKMPKIKKRFNDEFNLALKEPPTAAAAAAILQTASAHRMAKVTYYGQQTHEKKVLTYLEKAKKVEFTEDQLLLVCKGLHALEADKLLREFAVLGQERFPQRPQFCFLEAESYIGQGPFKCPAWKVKPLLERAQQLAQQMPPGDEQQALLEAIKHRQQLLGVQGLFTGGMFGSPFGDAFGDAFGGFGIFDEDEDDDDDDEDDYS